MLIKKFDEDLKKALKGAKPIRVSVIRMLKADINNQAMKMKKDSLNDDDVLKIVRKHIKQRNESIEQFKKGNRPDLVKNEQSELKVLLEYMPEQMSEKELDNIVRSIIEETEASSKKDMGRVIKACMDRVKGQADGKSISTIVMKYLR